MKAMHDDIKAYLVHSYLYYKLARPVISDTEYDMLCKKLYESGMEHELMSREDLKAGTGYRIVDYPPEIIAEAEKLLERQPKGRAAVGKMPERKKGEFKFTGHPMETYLLLGMYIDFGYSRQRDMQETIQKELQRRWSAGMHRSEFKKYFESWGYGPERFGLH